MLSLKSFIATVMQFTDLWVVFKAEHHLSLINAQSEIAKQHQDISTLEQNCELDIFNMKP